MSRKTSPIWRFFKEDPDDYTNAICNVPGCKHPIVSRGKSGAARGALTTGTLTDHVKNNHHKEHKEYLAECNNKKNDKKRKLEEEEELNELEKPSLASMNVKQIKTHAQGTLSGWVTGSGGIASSTQSEASVYNINDPRAREKHRGVLSMMILDLQPFSIVENYGFNLYSMALDNHFKLGSRKYYHDLINKIYDSSVSKLMNKIESDNPLTVTCQLDGWSVYHHGYIGLIVNYINKNWKRVNLTLACSNLKTIILDRI